MPLKTFFKFISGIFSFDRPGHWNVPLSEQVNLGLGGRYNNILCFLSIKY
jgi:hypothetical protein